MYFLRRKKVILIFLVTIILSSAVSSFSQDTLKPNIQGNRLPKYVGYVATGASIVYVGGWLYVNNNWYSKVSRVPFFFTNDIRGYLQIDKFLHSYGSYVETYGVYHFLRNAGMSRNKALLWSAPIGVILQSPKEIFDGRTRSGGFSWEDVIANFSGSAFFVGQELIFKEQLVKYKFSFSRSEYAEQAHGYLGNNFIESLFKDYNGHTYWFSVNARKLILKNKLPEWINIAAGYSANGMFGKVKNLEKYNGYQIPETQRYRQFLLSLDIDWSKIKTRSGLLKILLDGLNFIKLPFPAMEINSKGEMRGYWLYF